jgi:hypothetical protein
MFVYKNVTLMKITNLYFVMNIVNSTLFLTLGTLNFSSF